MLFFDPIPNLTISQNTIVKHWFSEDTGNVIEKHSKADTVQDWADLANFNNTIIFSSFDCIINSSLLIQYFNKVSDCFTSFIGLSWALSFTKHLEFFLPICNLKHFLFDNLNF